MNAYAPLSSPGSRAPITHDTVLIVEGRDPFGFFLGLLTEMELDSQIEIRNAGGNQDWPDYLLALSAISGFNGVVSLGLVLDSETDPLRAFQEVSNALQKANLPVPASPLQQTPSPNVPRVAVMLLPDPNTPGMLETLCWRSLSGHSFVACVDDYLSCIKAIIGRAVAREEKSRVHTFIAGQDEPWLLLGQAARAKLFPWASPAFDQLKAFVQGLIVKPP